MSSPATHSPTRVQALSDAELEHLEGLLDELMVFAEETDEPEPVFPLSLSAVDGLFAALALSPRNTAIGDWMRLVMGSAQFADKEATQLCRNLLIRHQQSVAHQLRNTELDNYYPCITVHEDMDDEPEDAEDGDRDRARDQGEVIDVQAWCAGFALGYEQQQEAWDARLDEVALTDLTLIIALRDRDAIHDAESDGELSFREAQAALVDLMRADLGDLLHEPADDLSLLLFSLQSLQGALLKPVEPTPRAKQKAGSSSAHQSKPASRSSAKTQPRTRG